MWPHVANCVLILLGVYGRIDCLHVNKPHCMAGQNKYLSREGRSHSFIFICDIQFSSKVMSHYSRANHIS